MRAITSFFALMVSCACDSGAGAPAPPPPAQEARNRLGDEKSPYLRQHADNPVDWYPWGDEAFEKAKKEDKPVFLSIGYSTCHWCHVMERESFMNEDVAKYLNEHFVAIKVDREERPDVDQIYMTACQLITGSGGWPLSVWLDADRRPFYAGTYFPPEDRFGRPGFKSLLERLHEAWTTKREDVMSGAEQLTRSIQSSGTPAAGELDEAMLGAGADGFKRLFDAKNGGFGGAPKFPRSIVHEFMLRSYKRTGDAATLQAVEKTLQAMRRGGMYDQLGGGFHRYSTDEKWLVPHFEKMLYDQALLVRAYVQAYQVTGKQEYADTARETLDFVLREMTSDEGGFYSAYDADSDKPDGEGHAEGAFYVWTPAQVKAVVPGEAGDRLVRALGVTEKGNFEEGTSILTFVSAPDPDHKKLLYDARKKRPAPHLDDKILADWNGLMIGAMGFAGAVLEEPRYLEGAERAANLLSTKLRKEDGRWLHRYSDGEAGIEAFLDDYAYLAEGYFLLHQATQKIEYLRVAVKTADLTIADFADPKGGWFQTAEKGEKLIARMKEAYDGALPSGNAVATLTLLRLADLCSRDDFYKEAEHALKSFAGTIARSETAYPYHLCAFDALVGPNQEIVLVGESDEMLRAVRRRFLPNTVLAVAPADEKLIPMVAERPMKDEKPTAYVCENYTCLAPTISLDEFVKQIGGPK